MKNKFLTTIVLSLIMIMMFVASAFASEWVSENGKWKYNKDGNFVISNFEFIKYGDDYNYYYFDENGYMVIGIKKIGDSYYSFNYDGTTNSNNSVTINGQTYKTGNKGVIKNIYSAIDVDAYNNQFFAEKAEYEKNKTEIDAAAQQVIDEEIAKQEEIAAIDARNEKMGPRGKGAVKKNDGGPGFANN